MIARPLRRQGPIPFSSVAHTLSSLPPPPAELQLRSRWVLGAAKGSGSASNQPAQTADAARATYHGHGVLSVRSPVTGRLYRFSGRGDQQDIDPRDRLLLSRLADLQVSMPQAGGAGQRRRDD